MLVSQNDEKNKVIRPLDERVFYLYASRHENPNTTHEFYNKIERCVASKKLKSLWRETPAIVSDIPPLTPDLR